MARPLLIEFAGTLCRATSQGNERKPIYRDDRDRARLLERFCAAWRGLEQALERLLLSRADPLSLSADVHIISIRSQSSPFAAMLRKLDAGRRTVR